MRPSLSEESNRPLVNDESAPLLSTNGYKSISDSFSQIQFKQLGLEERGLADLYLHTFVFAVIVDKTYL